MKLFRARLATVLVVVACASVPPSDGASPAIRRDVLSREEILNSAQQGSNS